MLPMPIPIPNWKLATLELDIFTSATFTAAFLALAGTGDDALEFAALDMRLDG